jgi:hypothetical protein
MFSIASKLSRSLSAVTIFEERMKMGSPMRPDERE